MAVKSICILLALSCCLLQVSSRVLFGAFNIQILGVTKMGKPEVVGYLTQILDRYDLVLVQEYRDKSGTAIVELLMALNEYSNDTYDYVISSRTGRSSSKEQYVYFFKTRKLSVIDSYEFVEPGDEFEREPYIVRFRQKDLLSDQPEFVVVGIHAKPDDAELEIDYLTDVYDDVVSTWGTQDVILAGDFNADCRYVTNSEWPQIRLRTQFRFTWLIDDDADTTVSDTDCAYDRLVVAGSDMIANSRSAQTYYFDEDFGLDQDTAKTVSDHYPVEMTIM